MIINLKISKFMNRALCANSVKYTPFENYPAIQYCGSVLAVLNNIQVGIDLIGPLPKTKSGNRYIITLVDYFSKWPEAAALPNKKAESVASFLYKIICRLVKDC
jgi:hypothetical protein